MSKQSKKLKYFRYPLEGLCPCDSGLAYGQCCQQKSFSFELDENGKVHKKMKLHPRLKPLIERSAIEFREILVRKQGHGDPILFQHHLDGEEDFWQHAKNIGRAANTPEQLIFAWRRSGFIVAEHSRKYMSENEYKEWTDAIDEYFAIKEDGFDPFFVFTYLSGSEYEHYKTLVSQLDHAIIALGFALTAPKSLKESASYFRYLLMQRAIRSLRTIREMYNTRYDDDCLSIARTMYEAYLRMKLLRLDPTSSDRFEAMLAHEVGAFKTKINRNGRSHYGICVDPETGKEFKTVISNKEILNISDFQLDEVLYYDLYPLLSGFVHPELTQDAN